MRTPTEDSGSTISSTVAVDSVSDSMRPTSPSPLRTVWLTVRPSLDPASIRTVHAKPWAGPTAMTCAGRMR